MIVLVTGATSGFGAAIARRFAREGHRIIATGRRTERLAALAAELGEAVALTLPLDVRDRAAVERPIAGAPAGAGGRSTCWSTTPGSRGASSRPSAPTSTTGRRWSTPTSRG